MCRSRGHRQIEERKLTDRDPQDNTRPGALERSSSTKSLDATLTGHGLGRGGNPAWDTQEGITEGDAQSAEGRGKGRGVKNGAWVGGGGEEGQWETWGRCRGRGVGSWEEAAVEGRSFLAAPWSVLQTMVE